MKRVSSFCSSAISKHPMFSQFSQLSQQLDDKSPFIYFVIPPGKTEEDCGALNLGEMFVAAQSHFLNVMWIKDEDCKDQVLQEDGNVFVFDPFGSPGFEYCRTKLSRSPRVEIISPTVLRQVFNDPQQGTFETKDCPVYTLAMKNMIISLSGFKNPIKDELETLVKWMNATFSSSLTKAVTHVVTASAITPKCIEANKEQIPVMTEDWIRQVWKDNQSAPVDASSSQYVKFICPVFFKVNICMSQITAVKKNRLKSEIEKQGGKCSSELVKKETDVLVVANPNGDKFKFAQKWNMKCVNPQWIENSLERGHLLSPDNYKVVANGHSIPIAPFNDLGPVTSTPAHSMMQDWNMTRCSAIVDDDRGVVEASKANFTRTSTEIHEETISKLRSSAVDNGAYLDGCKIYVVEYEKSDELKRELNKSGAIRMNQLCEGVTHVIVCEQKLPKSVQDKINQLESTPYVVTVAWVLQSAKDGSPADEDMFKYEPINTSTICQETINGPPNLNMSSHVDRISATTLDTNQHEVLPVAATISRGRSGSRSETTTKASSRSTSAETVSKSNSKTTTGFTSKSNSRTTSRDSSAGAKSDSHTKQTESEDSDATQEDNSKLDSNLNEADVEEDSPGLLVGITFQVVISDAEERKYVEGVIIENGGTLVKDNAEVAILSPICSSIEKDRADKSYTKYWLFDCMEYGSLDINNAFCHVPLPRFKKMEEIMRGVVVAVSQYTSTEREYIIEVVTALGARYQEVFARKDSNDRKNLRSTHLICKNIDTDKGKAARRWNVPVVVAEWLTDSFNARKRLGEEKYDPSLVNTSDERTVFMPTPQRLRAVNNALGNLNDNTSVRSVYPPSTQKGGPNAVFDKNKRNGNKSPAREDPKDKDKTPPAEPKPSSSKSAKPGPSNEGFRTPTSVPRKAPARGTATTSSKASNQQAGHVEPGNPDDDDEDSFLKTLPKCPPQEEIDRKMAEYKAMFPYTEDEYNELLENAKAQGIDLDAVSPFTSFEDRRLCDPDPDSPLLLGLPRHESRALKEQFEIALNRTPYFPKLKMKTPTSTPLSEIVRRFNAMSRQDANTPCPSPPGATSTPKDDLRRRAINRLSQGNLNTSQNPNLADDNPLDNPLEGIRKLGNKRPSDSSPEEDGAKSNKRARSTSDVDNDIGEPESTSPKENDAQTHAEDVAVINDENVVSAKKPDKIQHLTNLIAESHANHNGDKNNGSPIKRRSGGNNILVPSDEVNDEIERPHLSWVENEEEEQDKRSTVKKGTAKSRIASEREPELPTAVEEPRQEVEGRKRSSRLRKGSSSSVVSAVSTENGGRSTRHTRARSRSKTRQEDAPLGHQPIKFNKSKKKKTTTFPAELPDGPIFGLSSLDHRDKVDAVNIIKTLGGSVSNEQHFDINSHALIASRLLRSEKVLGAIASGKYILKPEYLTKCKEAGRFLPIDEEFLWHESNIRDDKERELARASYGWLKLQMENKDNRPMTNMKFYLLDNAADKVRAFKRLILAADGEIVTEIENATCVIKDDKSKTVVPEGMHVQNPMYLNTLILKLPESS